GSWSATVRLCARAITAPSHTTTQPIGTSPSAAAARASASARSMKFDTLVVARNFWYQPKRLSVNAVMTRKNNDRRGGAHEGTQPRLRSPSPRVPSGRLRPSAAGRGEGRGEGAFPHPQTRGDAPSPGSVYSKSGGKGRGDRFPQAGRGENRIARVIARAGLCSRRQAEEWISAGRVAVNGGAHFAPPLNVAGQNPPTGARQPPRRPASAPPLPLPKPPLPGETPQRP